MREPTAHWCQKNIPCGLALEASFLFYLYKVNRTERIAYKSSHAHGGMASMSLPPMSCFGGPAESHTAKLESPDWFLQFQSWSKRSNEVTITTTWGFIYNFRLCDEHTHFSRGMDPGSLHRSSDRLDFVIIKHKIVFELCPWWCTNLR